MQTNHWGKLGEIDLKEYTRHDGSKESCIYLFRIPWNGLKAAFAIFNWFLISSINFDSPYPLCNSTMHYWDNVCSNFASSSEVMETLIVPCIQAHTWLTDAQPESTNPFHFHKRRTLCIVAPDILVSLQLGWCFRARTVSPNFWQRKSQVHQKCYQTACQACHRRRSGDINISQTLTHIQFIAKNWEKLRTRKIVANNSTGFQCDSNWVWPCEWMTSRLAVIAPVTFSASIGEHPT